MTYPLNNIKEIKISPQTVAVTYLDNTTMTIKLKEWITFTKDYKNNNDQPIIDHCI